MRVMTTLAAAALAESSDWVARDNDANHNNQACPAGEESSAVSVSAS